MLDAYIIDDIKRREERRKQEQERPSLELPIEQPHHPPAPTPADDDRRDRGVVEIDYSVTEAA